MLLATWIRRFVFLAILLSATHSFASRMLVRVFVDTPEQKQKLSALPLDFASHYIDRYADVVADQQTIDLLRKLNFRFEIIDADLNRTFVESITVPTDMGLFHTVQEMHDELVIVSEQYPDITHLISIGKSIEGRDIWAIKVSDNPEQEEDEPEVLYSANIHAREIITPEIILYFLNYLVTNYGADSLVTSLVDNRQLWLIPTLNPDGHVYVENTDQWWRKNRRNNGDGTFGVDLNRNFGYKWAYNNLGSSSTTSSPIYRGTAPFSEPESQALRQFVMQHNFVAALTYHSYGNLMLFPWGYISENTPHHNIFLALAEGLTKENGYTPGNYKMGTIYQVNGDTDDYLYGEQDEKNMIFAFTPEVGSDKVGFFPPDTDIPRFVEENLAANVYLASIADVLADNPWRMLLPPVPVLSLTKADDDGVFSLSWTVAADTVNTPVAYDVDELIGYGTITDSAEAKKKLWNLDGFIRTAAKSYSGSFSYYSTTGNRINVSMTTVYSGVVNPGDVLSFRAWYDIENNYDYAYVEISTDNGLSFRSIPGNITTNNNPWGTNQGNGITGKSFTWKRATFDLSEFVGQSILIRIRYVTDSRTYGDGIFIDDIHPVVAVDSIAPLVRGWQDTVLVQQKSQPKGYGFRVRAVDRESQKSNWSDIATTTVDFGLKGDVNNDGSIDSLDVLRSAEIILSMNGKPTNGQLWRADLVHHEADDSIHVDIVDLIRLIKLVNTSL